MKRGEIDAQQLEPQMSDSKTSRSSMKVKLTLAFCSLLISLALAEFALELIGSKLAVDRLGKASQVAPGAEVILCVGDSFTWGGRVGREDTYPAQLQVMIDQRKWQQEYHVVNGGLCESNSKQLVVSLEEKLDAFKPSTLILLVGSANRFNLRGSGLFGFDKEIDSGTDRLLLYQLAKLAWLNLKGQAPFKKEKMLDALFRGRAGGDRPKGYEQSFFHSAKNNLGKKEEEDTEDELGPVERELWRLANEGQIETALQRCDALLPKDPGNETLLGMRGLLLMKNDQYEQGAKVFGRKLTQPPSSPLYAQYAAFFYHHAINHYADQNRFQKVTELAFGAIWNDPNEYLNYYLLSKAFAYQSHYDAADAVTFFDSLFEQYPKLQQVQWALLYRELFRNKTAADEQIKAWLHEDLDEVVRICQQKGVRVIVQNYPVRYPLANHLLQNLAKHNNLPFVDNQAVFYKIFETENERTYLFDDDHGNLKGHQVMADNLLKRLIDETILLPAN
jgi:tetratricopeptide (TPR) repeat protein